MKLKLLDTGYISTTNVASQTQISRSDRAGYNGSSSVSAIELNVSDITKNRDVRTEKDDAPAELTDPQTTLTSLAARRFSVTAVVQKSIVTIGWDVNNLVQLDKMERTRGLKLLYPSGTSDEKKTIVEAMGAENTGGSFSAASPSEDDGTVSESAPYLVGRVKNIQVADRSGGDYWSITFTFEICG